VRLDGVFCIAKLATLRKKLLGHVLVARDAEKAEVAEVVGATQTQGLDVVTLYLHVVGKLQVTDGTFRALSHLDLYALLTRDDKPTTAEERLDHAIGDYRLTLAVVRHLALCNLFKLLTSFHETICVVRDHLEEDLHLWVFLILRLLHLRIGLGVDVQGHNLLWTVPE